MGSGQFILPRCDIKDVMETRIISDGYILWYLFVDVNRIEVKCGYLQSPCCRHTALGMPLQRIVPIFSP